MLEADLAFKRMKLAEQELEEALAKSRYKSKYSKRAFQYTNLYHRWFKLYREWEEEEIKFDVILDNILEGRAG